MRTLHLILIIILIICQLNSADQNADVVQPSKSLPNNSIDPDKSEILISFTQFGFAGRLTPLTKLIRNYRTEKDAAELYINLINSNSVEHKLYGLYGLKIINDQRFDHYQNLIKNDKTPVTYGAGGCMLMTTTAGIVSELIKRTDFNEELKDKK